MLRTKKKQLRMKDVVIAVLLFMFLFTLSGCKGLIDNGENLVPLDTSQVLENRIDSVKNGHLGNYTTVTVNEIFDDMFPGGDWESFEGTSPSKGITANIVQFKGTWEMMGTMLIQFKVDDDNTFEVVHYEMNQTPKAVPYDIKKDLDELYGFYSNSHPDSGIVVDFSTQNNTLHGVCAEN